MSFRDRSRRFLQGRSGNDGLNVFLLVVCVLLLVTAMFFRGTVSYILRGAALLVLILNFLRTFSRNREKRARENAVFTRILSGVRSFFIRQFNRIKYIKTYRYRKCPGCKNHLRLPYKKGTHTVKCPKCGKSFDVRL